MQASPRTSGDEQEAVIDLSLEQAAAGGLSASRLDGRYLTVEVPAGVRDGRRYHLPRV